MKSPFANHADRIAAFESSFIYPVVSSEFCGGRKVTDVLCDLAENGAKVVQLREKHQSDANLFALACACREITARYGMLLFIDDRLDIALACNADGVHLGQDDMPVASARKIAPEMIIGASTHNAAEIIAAQKDGCSYLNIGPIYPTQTKSVACGALGVDFFNELKKLVTVPFSVMGGIKERHIADLAALGARHIAMVTEVIAKPQLCRLQHINGKTVNNGK
ncbi:MAG: thiamine phosphate synthase [Lentisphaerae bacterium]|nr:thiamine phosphate synthase [Lentisphaerota bacterium]